MLNQAKFLLCFGASAQETHKMSRAQRCTERKA